MSARRLADILPHLILPPPEAVIIILRQEWRGFARWRGRYRALYRSLRNSGNPRAHTEAVIRTGEEYVKGLEAGRDGL